jgi:hypothetical protein
MGMKHQVHYTRDEQLVNLERSVFAQMHSVLPKIEITKKPPELTIKEVGLEAAILELLEIERLNVSHQECQQ